MFVKKLTDTAIIPTRGSLYAAGHDVYSDEEKVIPAGEIVSVKTGISATAIRGHYLKVASRSGLYFKKNLQAFHGTIDEDYTGEIMIALHNLSDHAVQIGKGERIAQLIQTPVNYTDAVEVVELTETERGIGGFGSTGM